MFRIALRDLQFRRRRFLIAIVGASLVFALSLTTQGLAESFDRETTDTLQNMGAGTWFVSSRSPGPFTGFAPIGDDAVAALSDSSADEVSKMVVIRQPIKVGDQSKDGALIGVEPGGLGMPTALTSGRSVQDDDEAVVSVRSNAELGSTIHVGEVPVKVVGLTDITLLGGTPIVFTTLGHAQSVIGAGPLVTVLATRASVATAPDGLRAMTPDEVHAATLQPLGDAISTISMTRTILWLIAAMIVGAILYLNAIERNRDVAVMKAIGVTSRSVAGSMLVQAVIIGVISGLLGDAIALLIAPAFPLQVTVTATWLILLPVLATFVSCIGCTVAVRRAVKTSPALAFGGA